MKHKILFILPALHGGGAERVVLTLLKHLDRKKFNPILVLLKSEGRLVDQIPSDIPVIDLDAPQARYAIFKIANIIKQHKADTVFSTLGYLNLLMAVMRPFFSKTTRFISRESNTVSLQNKREKYPKLFDFLFRYFYNNFDQIITQSKYMRDDLVQNYKTDAKKIEVIYNPVDIENVLIKANNNDAFNLAEGKINLLAVGRLSEQKGFDMLIEAMSYLDDSYYLTILGEGEEQNFLEDLMAKYDVKDKVSLQGFTHNPYIYMKNSDLFILSSRFEGLPNVVLESNTCGTACVAINNPGGTAEIIEDGKTGLLVDRFDAKLLAQEIDKAMQLDFDREYIKENIEQNHSVLKIVKEYERVFLNKLKGCQ